MAFHIGKADDSIKTINDLRIKMEKMRIENTLLRDQIRALSAMPPELSSVYIIIQNRTSACFDDIKKSPKLANLPEERLIERINSLINMNILEVTSKDNVAYFSVKSPDMAEDWTPEKSRHEALSEPDVKEGHEIKSEPEPAAGPEAKGETKAAAEPEVQSRPDAKTEQT